LGDTEAEQRRQRIVAAILETPDASMRELARRLGHDPETVARVRRTLPKPRRSGLAG
jgi:transposase-like protein